MGEGLWLAQEGHTTLPQPLYHFFQCPFTVVCERGEQDEGVPVPTSALHLSSQPQYSTCWKAKGGLWAALRGGGCR